MTWHEANLSLQLLVEERIGAVKRGELQAARDVEDQAVAGLRALSE